MENNNIPKKGLKKGVFLGVWSGVFALVLAVLIALTCVATHYDSVLTQFMKSVGGGTSGEATDVDSRYFKLDYDSADALKAKEDELCLEMGREAVVMLENDIVNGTTRALPLEANAKVSIFGMAGAKGASSGTGSGAVATAGVSLSSSLKAAGFEVNDALVDYYAKNSTAHGKGTAAGGGTDKGDWSLGKEADFPTSGALAQSLNTYNGAAIFVLTRSGGEGGDLARTMDNHGGSKEDSHLSLSPSEKATLKGIKDCGKFSRIVVLVNSANAMEIGELKDYGVNAVLWYAGLGTTGLVAVGEVLAGATNPSGRLVDTYVYDNFSSPAMQNFGDYCFEDDIAQSYINYAENIYVGYKYYETRYEDKVTGRANVGNYDYDKTVLYPFGYGLSFTRFTYSDFDCKVENDMVKLSVKVTNNGTVAGKEVVQIYYSGEYTTFDSENGIEKAAVNLVEFAKTAVIEPTKSETLTVEFPLSDMKVYDEKVNKTYILEAGDYYVTAAKDAHDAVNNILKAKGYAVDGNAALTYRYTQSETVKCDKGVNAEITNLFEDLRFDGATYLSRSNWSVMDGSSVGAPHILGSGSLTTATGETTGSNTMGKDGYIGTIRTTAKIKEGLAKSGYEASGNPKDKNSYTANRTYGNDADLELVDVRGLPYDDEKWETFLNQMKFSEIYELFGHAGYGTIEVKSINKPKTTELDGPTGINSFINGTSGYSFPNEISMAATFNKEFVEEEGRLIGNDAILMSSGADRMSGWYAPAVNIHRTPFSGRNYEYYSEDAVLSGKMVACVIKGVQSKGMYVYMKHFALNDQETNRSGKNRLATFSTEQAAREIYLKPFEYGVVEGGAKGIMTSVNRIGTTIVAGSYALNTLLLRQEWGFNGAVITDYMGGPTAEFCDQVLASGGDLIMCSGWNAQKGVLSDFNAEWARALLRTAAHNTLYVQANSLAMNGFVHGTVYSAGFAVYKILLIVLWIVLVGGMAAVGFWVYRTIPWSAEQWESRKRISKKGWIIIGSVAGAVVVALVIVFCVWALPALSKALVPMT